MIMVMNVQEMVLITIYDELCFFLTKLTVSLLSTANNNNNKIDNNKE